MYWLKSLALLDSKFFVPSIDPRQAALDARKFTILFKPLLSPPRCVSNITLDKKLDSPSTGLRTITLCKFLAATAIGATNKPLRILSGLIIQRFQKSLNPFSLAIAILESISFTIDVGFCFLIVPNFCSIRPASDALP